MHSEISLSFVKMESICYFLFIYFLPAGSWKTLCGSRLYYEITGNPRHSKYIHGKSSGDRWTRGPHGFVKEAAQDFDEEF